MYGRLWHQCFYHLNNFMQLGQGNILVHCEHGYHRGPTGAALVFCSLANARSNDSQCNVQWFLDTLAKERIKSTR